MARATPVRRKRQPPGQDKDGIPKAGTVGEGAKRAATRAGGARAEGARRPGGRGRPAPPSRGPGRPSHPGMAARGMAHGSHSCGCGLSFFLSLPTCKNRISGWAQREIWAALSAGQWWMTRCPVCLEIERTSVGPSQLLSAAA